jgi:hypothetical protein
VPVIGFDFDALLNIVNETPGPFQEIIGNPYFVNSFWNNFLHVLKPEQNIQSIT